MAVLRPLIAGAMALSLSGCGVVNWFGGLWGDGGAAASGLPYSASLTRGEDRRDFTVEVNAVGADLSEARESARFPATRYCIETYGASDVDWVIDPATGDWAVSRSDRGLVVSGRCTAR
ncbi:MAG: hypothetical protein OIF48_10715 [Silicimonas sp.]|nr:hypothetical protein [Silicimonas sp.]